MRDIGRKRNLFHSTLPLGGDRRRTIAITFATEKLEWRFYQMVKKFDNMVIRFDTMWYTNVTDTLPAGRPPRRTE